MTVTRILDRITIEKGDKILVEENSNITRNTPVISRGGKDICSAVPGFVRIIDNVLYFLGKEQKIEIANGSTINVEVGTIVKKAEPIGEFEPFAEPYIAESDGVVHFVDIIPGSTLGEKIDNVTGNSEKYITDLHLDVKEPRINITDEPGNILVSYPLPAGAILTVEDNQTVKAGDVLAKSPKHAIKSNDITAGLPRVSELFEARKSKNPCVLARISGKVVFGSVSKGKRSVTVKDEFGNEFEHLIPVNKNLIVREGDTVEAGEPLCAGSPIPQDVLTILGENALQEYLMNEIQNVYLTQGVDINDKHIGIIIRQMLRKVQIDQVGDTRFIFGQTVDKYKFREENNRVIAEGGQPAVAKPMLQGIIKASLGVDSFISAASFQETTKVLTNAAISGATDVLHGIKENVAIGHMIPAGTGIKNYKDIKLYDDSDKDLDVQMNEILDRRRQEAEMESQLEETSFDTEDAD